MSDETPRDPLVSELLSLLAGGNAHVSLDKAVEDFPADLRGVVPEPLPYSAWQLIEHLRIAQRDILDFSAPPPRGYKSLKWPDAYWPSSPTPPTPSSWDLSIAAIRSDRESFAALLKQPGNNLHKPFPWGDGQTLLREALLIADHNSYHTGELVLLRRLLRIWKS
jgi:hypothetical protein